MRCPNCGSFNTQVRNCRRYEPQFDENHTVWRRRLCHDCGHKWTTYEVSDKQYQKLLEMEKEEDETDGE